MKKSILSLAFILGLVMICLNVFAADGDLIVNGKIGVGTTSPVALLDLNKLTTQGSYNDMQQWVHDSSNYSLRLKQRWPTGGRIYYDFVTKNNGADVNALTFDTNGNVGIGTTSPLLPLHVFGTRNAPAVSGTAPNGVAVLASNNGNNLYTGSYIDSPFGFWLQTADFFNLAVHYPLILNPLGGNVGIGTITPAYTLDVAGYIRGTNLNPSDIRFKENITAIESPLAKVTNMEGVIGLHPGVRQIGLEQSARVFGFDKTVLQIPPAVCIQETNADVCGCTLPE